MFNMNNVKYEYLSKYTGIYTAALLLRLLYYK